MPLPRPDSRTAARTSFGSRDGTTPTPSSLPASKSHLPSPNRQQMARHIPLSLLTLPIMQLSTDPVRAPLQQCRNRPSSLLASLPPPVFSPSPSTVLECDAIHLVSISYFILAAVKEQNSYEKPDLLPLLPSRVHQSTPTHHVSSIRAESYYVPRAI